MSLSNIDTFEHDISEEIKSKEATIGDIAAAGEDISNAPTRSSSTSLILISLGILFVILVVGLSIFLYIRYSQQSAVPPTATTQTTTGSSGPSMRMSSISPTLDAAIGSSIGTIQKLPYGYAIEVVSYSDVFAYMLKNESKYADEVAAAVGSPRDTSTTSPPFVFTDVTLNNQNMRVGVSGSSTIVYAFVNTNYLLIASDTQSILSLRSAILH